MCYEEKKMNITKKFECVYFAKPQCVGCNTILLSLENGELISKKQNGELTQSLMYVMIRSQFDFFLGCCDK